MNMKKTNVAFPRAYRIRAWAAVLLLVPAGLRADDAPAPSPEPATAAAKRPFEWQFSLATSYTHNFNRPPDGTNTLRVFDTEAGRPQFDLATFTVLRPAAPFGFQVDLVSGGDAPIMASQGAPFPEAVDFRQAFASWKPGSGGLELRLGKFVTSAGYEVIPDGSNPNPTFSNSFLFGYAIPFTHTGLRAIFPAGKTLTLTAGINRGWDKVKDNNGAPALELVLSAVPTSWLTLAFDTHHGPEQTDDTGNWRHLYDFVAQAKLSTAWTVAFNATYGTEADVPGTVGRSTWRAWAAYGTYAPRPRFSVSLRLEEFRDPQGVRTGTAQTLRDANLTVNCWVHPQVLVRLDGRADFSTAAVFPKGEEKGRRQTTAALALVFKL